MEEVKNRDALIKVTTRRRGLGAPVRSGRKMLLNEGGVSLDIRNSRGAD